MGCLIQGCFLTERDLWAIVLAGGDGERLRSWVAERLGRPKPKQYCAFVGTRSMFQHTLDRAVELAGPRRTVTVVGRNHYPEARLQIQGRRIGTVLLQPANRDTAAGVFLPLTYVRARDGEATVVIYPSDHFVHPEPLFTDAVRRAVSYVQSVRDRLVLLGVSPEGPELDYGWILRGDKLIHPADGRVWAVRAFLEKPDANQARALMASGALWNTLILAAKAETLWALGWRCLPEMMLLFERFSSAIGTGEEEAVLETVYGLMPVRNFSSDLLQRVPTRIVAMELDGVLWSDWGKPERILETLRRIGQADSSAGPSAALSQITGSSR